MSNTRYLEIDSTYRDRTLWPKAGEFEIPISQSGRKDRYSAIDPVSLGVPINAWTSNRFRNDVTNASISGTFTTATTLANASSDTVVIAQFTAGQVQTQEDYYINAILETTSSPPTSLIEIVRITRYRYLYQNSGFDYVEITVATPLTDSLITTGRTLTISDPTVVVPGNPQSQFFVPNGLVGSNCYYGYYLYNEIRDQYRKIINYDSVTHLLEVDETTAITGWQEADNYSIRKELPTMITATGTTNTLTTVVLNNGINEDNAYSGQFIRVRPLIYYSGMTAPEGETRRIVNYDGATKTANVSPPFTAVIPNTFQLEVLDFSYDNLNPFVYNGSLVSQQEMVCYEIELLNVVLPNEILKASNGSRVAFYPFVYIELCNVSSAGAGKKNLIYSNNPYSTNAMFRATVDDTNNPLSTAFIKIDSDGMTQTVKFKPNDNLYFSVRLPDGTIYETIEEDRYSPMAPNPRSQISAAFSLKRL